MATEFGAQPRPWILVTGADLEEATELRAALGSLSDATVHYWTDVTLVDQAEYDMAVCVGDAGGLEDHLDVLSFGTESYDGFKLGGQFYRWRVVYTGRSQQSRIPDGIPSAVEQLATATLVPWLSRQERPYGVLAAMDWGSRLGGEVQADGLSGFLLVGTGEDTRAVAGGYARRGDSRSQAWLLPPDVERQDAWLAVALSHFARRRPDRYPGRAVEWVTDPEWMSPSEIASADSLAALARERRTVLDELDRRAQELAATIDEQRAEVDAGGRRLLTHQGDDLVDEVEGTLTRLGFTCLRPDAERAATKDALLEDLEVQDGDWNSLVEVRGYGRGGAKTADLQRIGRFVAHYIRRTGEDPSATWYVVNHSFNEAPPARRRVLAGSEADVELFAEGGGLVIDTRDLFRLRVAVESGELTPEAARDLLKSTTGVLDYPTAEPT